MATTELPATRTIPGFAGEVLVPGDPGYDEARALFNGAVDRRPAVIARCAGVADVQAALRHADALGLPIAVLGGGHGVAGLALVDDGLVLDLRAMRGVRVDPVARTAVVGGGATWGDLDAAAAAHGLAVTGGRVPTTGVAGLTMSSGSGWLERSLGLSADSLLAVELVTADGSVVVADAEHEPELFWGVRGGGGAFGVTTSLTFRLHPIPELLVAGMVLFDEARARELLPALRDLADAAPEQLGIGIALLTAPPALFVPEALHGRRALGVILVHNGPPADGEAAVAPFLALGPDAVALEPMPYVAVQQLLVEASPHGARGYWKAGFLQELTDEAIEALLDSAAGERHPLTQLLFGKAGGAIARVPEEATALSHRAAGWSYHLLGMWTDPADDEREVALVRGVADALAPLSLGAYPNWQAEASVEEVEASFGAQKVRRLRALKARLDPADRFARHTGLPRR